MTYYIFWKRCWQTLVYFIALNTISKRKLNVNFNGVCWRLQSVRPMNTERIVKGIVSPNVGRTATMEWRGYAQVCTGQKCVCEMRRVCVIHPLVLHSTWRQVSVSRKRALFIIGTHSIMKLKCFSWYAIWFDELLTPLSELITACLSVEFTSQHLSVCQKLEIAKQISPP